MSSGFVNWIENAHFFGRPHTLKRQTNQTCADVVTKAAYSSAFASCRNVAAGTCQTPGPATRSEDSCICSSLYEYDKAFSACIYNDTPYFDCINPNNEADVSSWSSDHCESSPSSPSPTSPKPDTTPTTPTPSPTKSDPQDSTSPSSTSTSSKEATPKSSDSESSSDPPSTTSEKSSTTPMSTPSSVPKPSLVPVTPAPHVAAQSASVTSSSTFSTHSNLPRYTGSGNLLQGYCVTPQYTLLGGPTAYWAPVIGCMGDRPDCCPFDIPTSASTGVTGTVPPTITISVPQSGLSSTSAGNNGGFPSAILPAQATLERCPDDYFSISDACCPSNYFPWSTDFGGQTPCYSTLPTITTPPPIPESLLTPEPTGSAQASPTSAIVNVVYAMRYPVKPSPKSALTTNVKIGIGAGAGGAALVLGALVGLLIWKHKAHKRDKDTLKSLSGMGSTRHSVAASSAVGGVAEWRKNVHASPTGGRFYEGLEPAPEPQPTLPNVGMTPHQYPADWRPGRRTISPPLPGTFVHNSVSTPPIPEGLSEADSQNVILNQRYSNNTSPMGRSDGGYSSGNRSEMYTGEYFPRQELQGVPEERQWVQHGTHVYQDGVGEPWGTQQTQYHEAPAGRMTPRVG